jgi:hypothetical protein
MLLHTPLADALSELDASIVRRTWLGGCAAHVAQSLSCGR